MSAPAGFALAASEGLDSLAARRPRAFAQLLEAAPSLLSPADERADSPPPVTTTRAPDSASACAEREEGAGEHASKSVVSAELTAALEEGLFPKLRVAGLGAIEDILRSGFWEHG